MLKEYFKIIRQALTTNRKKGKEIYYESHHIVPKSFKKKSKLVLLTPEEHYECHKILAEVFSTHLLYGQKMLWAFHRLAYDKKRKLTKEQFGEARRILMNIWKRPKSEETKRKISLKLKGNTNNNCYVGMPSRITKEGKKRLGNFRRKVQTGKIGINARASKGTVIYEDLISGAKVQEGSMVQLSKKVPVAHSTLAYALKTPKVNRSYKVYYL